MTIGYLLDDTLDKNDGVQQAVTTLGEHLRRQGHDVHYIVANTKDSKLKNVHSVGSLVNLKFNGNTVRTPIKASSKKIKEMFSQIDFDVLHVQMPFSPLLSGRVLKMSPKNIKKVGTFHILPYNKASEYGTNVIGKLSNKSLTSLDKVYAVSKPAKEFMNRRYKIDGDILPNPVDYNFYSRYKKKKSNKTEIVFVGRFDKRKGAEQLVKAFSLIPEDIRSKAKLTMCGKGPLFKKLNTVSKHNDLNILFPGFVSEEEKAQYLANADIAVFPSTGGESFGIVLVEAMSAGSCITIGGNNPGYKSVLEEWPETLFNPDDITEFSKKLVQLIEDGENARLTGSRQHNSVKKYDVSNIADQLLKNAYI